MSEQIPNPEKPEASAIMLSVSAEHEQLRIARAVPFRVSITIPLLGLKLRDLSNLQVGRLFPTAISAAEDVPVRAGGAVLGWAELDNMEGQMAVRLTRLS
jgi:flagellar motor switch/type III secretory pathway protein FliN